MSWLYDARTECWSVMTSMAVGNYVNLVKRAHAERGALSGQRDVLKTTTAKRIRDRMVADIQKGAVLPPVVIGAVVDPEKMEDFPLETDSPSEFLQEGRQGELAIIDGMQRTAALMEAVQLDPKVLDNKVRVEFWLAPAVSAMIYRMLVLNTGQVPWTLSRQLAVIYASLLREIRSNVPEIDKIFSPEKPGRRVGAAQYASEDLVELYIGFSLRKTSVDTKEALSEEFSRLDFVENLSDVGFQDQFYTTLSILAMLDKAFSRFDAGVGGERFSKGRAIFDAQPARMGFMVAVATRVLGRPGLDHPSDVRVARMESIKKEANNLVRRLDELSSDEVGEFLKLDVLAEILSRKVGQVGRYERSIFFEAFRVLIDEKFNLPNMEPCWRAS